MKSNSLTLVMKDILSFRNRSSDNVTLAEQSGIALPSTLGEKHDFDKCSPLASFASFIMEFYLATKKKKLRCLQEIDRIEIIMVVEYIGPH
ncbi:hypothetical protein STEG23_030161 [Scotinomys teguina]